MRLVIISEKGGTGVLQVSDSMGQFCKMAGRHSNPSLHTVDGGKGRGSCHRLPVENLNKTTLDGGSRARVQYVVYNPYVNFVAQVGCCGTCCGPCCLGKANNKNLASLGGREGA